MICISRWLPTPPAHFLKSDELGFRNCFEIHMPYLGPVVGVYGEWTPLSQRGELFEENLDESDPWQFKNVRVV